MSTGKPFPTAASSFAAIAADPEQLRSFLAGIGSSQAPSRVRAAALLDDCESVCDAGCGPAVMYEALQLRRTVPLDAPASSLEGLPPPLQYVGVDPVEELLHLAQSRVPAAIDVSRGALTIRDWREVAELGPHELVLDDPAAYLARRIAAFDGVLLRHVVEHLAEPWPLLSAAAVAARRVLVVVVSQATRAVGVPMALMTDHYLGAFRWSHWRPRLLRHVAEYGLELVAHESGPPLVVREELFAWRRP